MIVGCLVAFSTVYRSTPWKRLPDSWESLQNRNKRYQNPSNSSWRWHAGAELCHPDQQFLVTRIGCGIAGFSPEYTSEKDFEMSDDPARKILGGDWQIPTKAIWDALVGITTNGWDSGYKFTNNGQTLFLPAAGYVFGKSSRNVGSQGRYWSGTAYSSSYAYRLSFSASKLKVGNIARSNGCSVRPVRLVAVD